jgi:hypothetical protein
MIIRRFTLLAVGVVVAAASGCAAYRSDSNIATDPATATRTASTGPVLIAEDSLPQRKYKTLGPIEVSVKKLTVFHADPTREQANEVLREKARAIGADAVVNVTYKSGIGLMTWGYMDANGTGVKLTD